jgi:hypothetical protein
MQKNRRFPLHNCSTLHQYSSHYIILEARGPDYGKGDATWSVRTVSLPLPLPVIYFINCAMDVKGSSHDHFHGDAIIPRFSRLRTSRFHKFPRSVQELQHSGPAMNRSMKIVRQLEHFFEPYHTMFKELKETKEAASITVCLKRKQDRQCTYNVTLRLVRATVVAVKKQLVLHNLRVCICSLSNPACNACAT